MRADRNQTARKVRMQEHGGQSLDALTGETEQEQPTGIDRIQGQQLVYRAHDVYVIRVRAPVVARSVAGSFYPTERVANQPEGIEVLWPGSIAVKYDQRRDAPASLGNPRRHIEAIRIRVTDYALGQAARERGAGKSRKEQEPTGRH
jgi:hypothetical protein